MENRKIKSLTSQMQLLLTTNKELSQKLKQRLVLESNNVKNPFEFMVGLFNEGVLRDGSSDTEANFGLKEIIVQLAMMMAFSKGADAMSGLIKALDQSGNSELLSALRTWIQEDFAVDTDGDLSKPKEVAFAVESETSVKLPTKGKDETSENNTKLTDQIMSQHELIEQLEACSKRTVALALQNANNHHLLQGTYGRLENSTTSNKNHPTAVKSLSNPGSTTVKSTFFEQAPPSDELSKVATFKCQQSSTAATKVKSLVQFDKTRMITCAANCGLYLWNWQENEEEPIRIAAKVQNITQFQYDEDIIVLGTAEGTVHLFDARTLEEKWTVRLGEPVIALKFVESTLVVITRDGDHEWLCWMDISRSDMRLLNQRWKEDWKGHGNLIPGICLCPDTSFVYYNKRVNVHDTKSGTQVQDEDYLANECYLTAPASIGTLTVGDLISLKNVVIAGCIDGRIAMWNTSKFKEAQSPVKTLQGHNKTVVSLCAFNGHLLSLDEGGKLLMWSGYDLENENLNFPIPRLLAANGFSNVQSLVAHERWFATSSSEDGIINIWTVPDLWLRTG